MNELNNWVQVAIKYNKFPLAQTPKQCKQQAKNKEIKEVSIFLSSDSITIAITAISSKE